MGYLNTYSRKRKFQGGGEVPAAPAPEAGAGGPEAGGAGGGGVTEEQLIEFAYAAVQGDQGAATQLGMALAPMIVEQAESMGAGGGAGGPEGGAPAEAGGAPAEGEPVFRRGGKLVRY